MARIEGLEKLVAALRSRATRARKDARVSVAVGYSASYAVFVHENLQARHANGQAKFIEQPARSLAPELGRIAGEAVRRGSTLAQALVLAGLRLQRESQQMVPVDTGNLRASAFTVLEEGGSVR